jgi:hypothetical protein
MKCAVTNMRHGHAVVALVDRVDDPVAAPAASIKQMAEFAVLGN